MQQGTKNNKTQDEGVDFVIIWVDGADREWQAEKLKYSNGDVSSSDVDASIHRYRDWDNLQYLFRSIETFAPWVRKVHFVTAGHVPEWLNLDAEKLNFVKHEDYIPKEYLPTFSSHPIELNLHRIKGLSEKFVFLNDDMFLTRPVRETDFFVDGKPCDTATFNRIVSLRHDDVFPHVLLNNLGVINENFSKRLMLKKHFSKWFTLKYGIKPLIRTLILNVYSDFSGFMYYHMPSSFLKSTFETVWSKEGALLHETSSHKFRHIQDVNQYIMKGWQLVTGQFHPVNLEKTTKYFSRFPKQQDELKSAILEQKYSVVCVNDTESCENFEEVKSELIEALDTILPEKSSFEV